jgi:hypothetical protein
MGDHQDDCAIGTANRQPSFLVIDDAIEPAPMKWVIENTLSRSKTHPMLASV